jgi:hypothetical protein
MFSKALALAVRKSDGAGQGRAQVLTLLALLVQKYKHLTREAQCGLGKVLAAAVLLY